MPNTVVSYPTPPYRNPPIEPQFFRPSQFPIIAIQVGLTTIVTMGNSTNNVAPNLVVGMIVRLTIPSKYGSRALNEQEGHVISIPTTTSIEVDINSIGTDPFILSPTFLPFEQQTLPQIMPVGDINSGAINAFGPYRLRTFINGSFRNISPF